MSPSSGPRPGRALRPVPRGLLSPALKQERGGATSDGASIVLVEWHGGTADHLATLDIRPGPAHRSPFSFRPGG